MKYLPNVAPLTKPSTWLKPGENERKARYSVEQDQLAWAALILTSARCTPPRTSEETVSTVSLCCQTNNLLGRVLHPIRHRKVHARVANHALTFFNVRALEPHHHRHFDLQISRRLDDPTRHHVATHNPTENIDQNSAHILIRQQDAKRCFDAFLRSATTDVEKICRLTTSEFDDVHGSHRKSGAVDHTRDITVELDVVEIKLRRLNLERILFIQIAQVEKIFMTKQRIVVEVDLRVERKQSVVLRQQERIDLHQRRIHLLIRRVERLHELHRLIHKWTRQSESKRELTRLKWLKAYARIDRLFQDFFRSLRGDFFDIHATR